MEQAKFWGKKHKYIEKQIQLKQNLNIHFHLPKKKKINKKKQPQISH